MRMILVASLLAAPGSGYSETTLVGPATAVEGDVIEIGGRHIRLSGIRAPALAETCRAGGEAWPCGKAALDWLKGYLEDREVACRERGRDEYGRMVAVCYVGGENLSGTLAREGWALNNPADGMDYAGAEEEAHLAGRGMWKGSGERP